jgi:hypothetical protein
MEINMTDDKIVERVAKAIAEHSKIAALKFNLREINQEDQFDAYMNHFPLKVTDADRDLARAAIAAIPAPTELMTDAIEKHFLADGKWELDDNKKPAAGPSDTGRWLWLSDANYGFRPVDLAQKIVSSISG